MGSNMVKIEIDIQEAEYEIITKIAEKMGISVEGLIQQAVNQELAEMTILLQRSENLES
jgi:uncharacterized tellurite resistance protein B-like protein